MAQIGLLTLTSGPDAAAAMLDKLTAAKYGQDIALHLYVDCKVDGRGLARVFNIEALTSQVLDIRNIATRSCASTAERETYLQNAFRALALAHFCVRRPHDYVAYLAHPVPAAVLTDIVSNFSGKGRVCQDIYHGDDTTSFVIDCRRDAAVAAVATAARLYQSGAILSLPDRSFDYALSCAFAALERIPGSGWIGIRNTQLRGIDLV